ncbi:hypothetical protein [Antiquaquibacter soli]|uniref:Uncharacterized protein n=1 Tax=Antiquaquibacter soli TaxID=3064523 RepID=A0ABT9BW28_9MICO|nr:hypothetical protein [Protaetiibacter sp. WY-16]MDO7883512.1 hypothetical protein [Protaetiibacter sp. WY-16]
MSPRDPTEWNRVMGDDADELGMQLCRALFPRVDEANRKVTGVYCAIVDERSSLRLDDRYLGAWRGGGLHGVAFRAALDALMTVQLILEQNVIPMIGLYPLLRAAIENSALAIYLLEPVERDERLRRAYWVAAEDARLRYVHEREREAPDARDKLNGVKEEIRLLVGERPSLGEATDFRFDRVQYTDLVQLADRAVEADPAINIDRAMSMLGWWQVLSGLSHGKQWSYIYALERSGAVVDEEDESAQVLMTSSPAAIAVILERAIIALETALRLYGRRSKQAWNQPEDASEPPAVAYVEIRRARGHSV